MIDDWSEDPAPWCEQGIEIRLRKYGRLWSFKRHRLCLEHMCLHLVQIDIIVELYDINVSWVWILRVKRHLDIHPWNTVGLRQINLPSSRLLESPFMNLFVAVNDVLELDCLFRVAPSLGWKHSEVFVAGVDLAHAINSAHDQLVNVSAKEQIDFEAKSYQNNVPDELATLYADLQMIAHLLDSLSADFLHSTAKDFKRRECLFLGLFASMNISKCFHFLLILLLHFCAICFVFLSLFVHGDNFLELVDDKCAFFPRQMQGQLSFNVHEVLPQLPG